MVVEDVAVAAAVARERRMNVSGMKGIAVRKSWSEAVVEAKMEERSQR